MAQLDSDEEDYYAEPPGFAEFQKYFEEFKKRNAPYAKLTYHQIWAELDRDDLRRRTCEECGFVCESDDKLATHKTSENHLQRMAEQAGKEFIPKAERRVHCDICDSSMLEKHLKRHLESAKHAENKRVLAAPARFYCTVCEKPFHGKRGKRDLQAHLQRPIHLKKVTPGRNAMLHNAMMAEYLPPTST